MTLMKHFLGASAALALMAGAVAAEPAIIFDLGGKFDKSFNEAAFNGATKWAEETGGTFKELEMQSEAQREQALRRLAEAGSNPIVMTGFAFADALNTVAPDFPDTKFAIVDMVVDQPNVQSVIERRCARRTSSLPQEGQECRSIWERPGLAELNWAGMTDNTWKD